MKLNLRIALFIGVLVSFKAEAQTTDLARVEYLNLPFSKSKNALNRYRALVQVPIPLDENEDNIVVLCLEYRFVDVIIEDEKDVFAFGDHSLESVQQMSGHLGYVWRGKENWRFGIKAGVKLESDLAGKPIKNDFIFDGGIYAVGDFTDNPKEGEKPHRLILGLTYSTVPGRWYPLPLVNYYREFSRNWTYTLGVPKTNVRYYLNNTHKDALQAFATLDNVFSNIQQNFAPRSEEQNPEGKMAASIEETIGLLGLGYEHYFTEHLVFYAYAAHSVYNNFRLSDKDGKKLYKINTENSPYFRTGIKFKY